MNKICFYAEKNFSRIYLKFSTNWIPNKSLRITNKFGTNFLSV